MRTEKEIFVPKEPNINFTLLFFKYMFLDLFAKPTPVTREKIEVKAEEIKVWMIGHATVLINFYGTTILTDPVFVNIIPPRRLVEIGYKFSDLPKIDIVLLSHAHMDHFNIRSLKRLSPDTTVIVPRNCSDLLKGTKLKNVSELDYEQRTETHGIEIFAHQTQHWGERFPWDRRNRGFNCYVLKKNGKTVLFGGDTGYKKQLFENLAQYDIDLAFIPIGAYYPWNDFSPIHLDPKEAIQAFIDMKAKHFIPIHWGNFRLSYEPWEEPPQLLTKLAAEKGFPEKIHILRNGQTYTV